MWTTLISILRGEVSFPRVLLVNGGLVLIAAVGFFVVANAMKYLADDVSRLWFGLGRDGILTVVFAFVLTSLWNTARHAAAAGKKAAPAAAKLLTIVMATGLLHYLVTTVPGRVAILSARLDPALADYVIARTGTNEVTFTGALNDRSVRELSAELYRPGVKVLRITSRGGLIVPAMELADVVARRKIAVAAIGHCLSSCPLLLAASPSAIVTPATRIAFHRPTPAAIVSMDDRDAIAIASAAWYERFRDYGISAPVVEEMSRHEVWSPGLSVLGDIGLVKFVLDGPPARLIDVRLWCRDHVDACGAR